MTQVNQQQPEKTHEQIVAAESDVFTSSELRQTMDKYPLAWKLLVDPKRLSDDAVFMPGSPSYPVTSLRVGIKRLCFHWHMWRPVCGATYAILVAYVFATEPDRVLAFKILGGALVGFITFMFLLVQWLLWRLRRDLKQHNWLIQTFGDLLSTAQVSGYFKKASEHAVKDIFNNAGNQQAVKALIKEAIQEQFPVGEKESSLVIKTKEHK